MPCTGRGVRHTRCRARGGGRSCVSGIFFGPVSTRCASGGLPRWRGAGAWAGHRSAFCFLFLLPSFGVFYFPLFPCFACVNSVNSRPVCLLGLSVHVATRLGENCPSVGVGVDACIA